MCLANNPSVCKDVGVPLMLKNPNELQLPMNCVRAGQLESVKYTEMHPEWRVTRWKCPPPAKNEQEI